MRPLAVKANGNGNPRFSRKSHATNTMPRSITRTVPLLLLLAVAAIAKGTPYLHISGAGTQEVNGEWVPQESEGGGLRFDRSYAPFKRYELFLHNYSW